MADSVDTDAAEMDPAHMAAPGTGTRTTSAPSTSDPSTGPSVWMVESQSPRVRPPLRGRIATDVAIIGGGLTGVSTAWHLRARWPDLGIALLEAGILGHGASGRNGGQVLSWIHGIETTDPEETRRIHAVTRAGIDIAEWLSERFAPPGTFRRGGCVEVFTDAHRAELAEKEAAELAELGIPVERVAPESLGAPGIHGAWRDPLAGCLNGFALLQGMRGALVERGVDVYEHTRVTRVRPGREVVLETPEGEVRAGAIVLATNAYTPALGFFRRGLMPLHAHVLATEPLAPARWSELGWDHFVGLTDDMHRVAYASRTGGGRLVFGGGGNDAYSYARRTEAASAASRARARPVLERSLARYFPKLAGAKVEHRWAGTLALTLDRVCSIGVGGDHANVYHALGYSGHGLALALLAGRVLADLHAGDHEAWSDLPFYQRPLLPLPPEPLRWLGYQVYTRLTGRSPRKYA